LLPWQPHCLMLIHHLSKNENWQMAELFPFFWE
jgi:hypothetical protein